MSNQTVLGVVRVYDDARAPRARAAGARASARERQRTPGARRAPRDAQRPVPERAQVRLAHGDVPCTDPRALAVSVRHRAQRQAQTRFSHDFS